jgi:DNA-binding transcriptional regulator WhiA
VGCATPRLRGAFLACGSLTETGRSPYLVITSPGPEAALALLGAARKLGVTAKTREVHASPNPRPHLQPCPNILDLIENDS